MALWPSGRVQPRGCGIASFSSSVRPLVCCLSSSCDQSQVESLCGKALAHIKRRKLHRSVVLNAPRFILSPK
jgi:hypothetical protein